MNKFVSVCTDPDGSQRTALSEASSLIHRMLGFKQISVALRDASDGRYRYVHFLGLTPSAVDAYSRIAYTQRDVMDYIRWPRIRISDTLHFFPVEFSPYVRGEEETYNKPSKLGETRRRADDMLEDDYVDVFMYGWNHDLVGWLELSATHNGKIPSRSNIKWIEFLAQILGKTIESHSK